MSKQLILDYAMSFVGVPYIWGGDDPISGFDCSGFIQEILKMNGIAPDQDLTAQGLYDYFLNQGTESAQDFGALVFFGKSNSEISHIGFCVDEKRMIEAGGGGHKTLTRIDAALQNAYIRIRPIEHRKDLVGCIMPRYIY